ncbi:uncharacterized protein Tco025E_03496 [Trypanosoma conorhini]|uniref:Uncharacterized protein n=1 Tax=Trypanosoma conorhini TaxID=83891 RepID=A0A3R7LW13_9TRYP|nr:uncharacterized protein Tco025E_03496 [Trypanosoma conorhini]RNF21715.1 hypothetical protein Tco025E_03496 [Trypanosoma conorhini]
MQRPLSDEERAAKEARLAQLRGQMNTRDGVTSSAAAAAAAMPQTHTTTYAYNDARDSDEEDACDDDEGDTFFREAERAHEGAAGVCMYAKPMGELMGETVETGPNARRCTVGDFELLRLAKMGDLLSFKEFAAAVGIDPAVFQDNHGRNALHYAADSGSVAMLQYLIEQQVPFTRDEKKMTPVDIAVLNQHNGAAKLLAETFSEAAEALKSYEEAIEAFTQPPPKFTMSKPAPPAPKESRQRSFWKNKAAGAAATPATTDTFATPLTVSQLTEAHHDQVVRALGGVSLTRDSHGFHNWLPPAESATLAATLPHATVVGAMQTVDGEEALRGVVVAVPLGGSLVGKSGALKAEDPVLVTQLAVSPTSRASNVATLMMAELQNSLQASKRTTVVFRSQLQLPVPAVGLLKWSQRSIAPGSVMRQRHSTEVFPDFYTYDEILRADIVAKHALTKSFCAQKASHREGWCGVDRGNLEQVKLVHAFVAENAAKLFDVAYVPDTTEDLLRVVAAEGLSAFVYVSPASGAITDFVVLRLRNPERPTGEGHAAAMCVYAIFTSFKGSEKAEEVLVLCEKLKCETVLIPNTFGFLDGELSRANFEELLLCREYLYVLRAPTESALPPTPLSKVAIPCAFI